MKRTLLYLLFTLSATISVADNKTTIDSLKVNKWEESMGNNDYRHFNEFDTRGMRDVYYTKDGNRIETIKRYYLSNTLDNYFNPDMIGISKSGKYIISYNDSINTIERYQIISLLDEHLIYKYIPRIGERKRDDIRIFVPYIGITNIETTINMLTSNKWNRTMGYGHSIDIIKFTDSIMSREIRHNKQDLIERSYLYYLSNNPDRSFDKDKVSKIKNGSYIITSDGGKSTIVYKIMSLSDSHLVLKFIPKPEEQMIGGISSAIYLPYY